MTPDFQSAHCKLFRGDCLEIMPQLEPVDAIITDPPYGTTACKWDSVIPFEPMWENLKRLSKPKAAIVLFGSQPFTSALIMSNVKMFKYDFSWDKKHPKGHLNANKMPLRRHEDILVFGDGVLQYNPQMRTGKMRTKGGGNPFTNKGTYGFHMKPVTVNDQYHPTSVLEFSNANQRSKQHPNEKPVPLLEYLIKTYTNEGDTVLDFTFGSGTTGVAAINTGRKFVGIEKDEKYFDIAVERIKKAEEVAAQNLPLEMAV